MCRASQIVVLVEGPDKGKVSSTSSSTTERKESISKVCTYVEETTYRDTRFAFSFTFAGGRSSRLRHSFAALFVVYKALLERTSP